MSTLSRADARRRRHKRIRRKLNGTAERPRMAIMISSRRMYVQFIDDEKAMTLASTSSDPKEMRKSVASARQLGQSAGKVALEKGIKKIIVDRGGFRFHGRVKAIVDGVTEAGVDSGTVRERPEKKESADSEPKGEKKKSAPKKQKPVADDASKEEK